jgi:hypothetical protein
MKYQIISYDVWGNARDGFEVNAAYYTGKTIDIEPDASDYAINRKLGIRGVTWDGEPEYTLYGTVKRNGMPAMELRRDDNEH